jgi:hypothetical protein
VILGTVSKTSFGLYVSLHATWSVVVMVGCVCVWGEGGLSLLEFFNTC